jgi:hypothetical protein
MITEIGTPSSHNKTPRMVVASNFLSRANGLSGLMFHFSFAKVRRSKVLHLPARRPLLDGLATPTTHPIHLTREPSLPKTKFARKSTICTTLSGGNSPILVRVRLTGPPLGPVFVSRPRETNFAVMNFSL